MNPSQSPTNARYRSQWHKLFLVAVTALILGCGGGGGGAGPAPASSNSAPSGVQLVEVSSQAVGTMSVSWLPATDDSTPAASLRYQVHASTDASYAPSASTLKFEGVGVNSANISTGFSAGSTYHVKVVVLDAQNASNSTDALPVRISNTSSTLQAGVVVNPLQAQQIASTTPSTVVLKAGVVPPAAGQFIASAEGDGYLRKVTGVSNAAGGATLQTQTASINEAMKNVQVSSTFKMNAVPAEVAATAVQSGLAVINTGKGTSNATYNWANTGVRYTAATQSSKELQTGLVSKSTTTAFKIEGTNETISGSYGKIYSPTRVSVGEGSSGTVGMAVSTISDDKPWNSSTPVGICKVTLGAVTGEGAGSDPSKVSVTLGAMDTLQTVAATGRIKAASQAVNISVAPGAANAAPYKITATAYLEDVSDNCSGGFPSGWREKIDFTIEIFVVTDTFPENETATLPFSGSGDFTVKNTVTTTFNPVVSFEKRLGNASLEYAKIQITASPKINQTLTIRSSASGSIDSTLPLLAPRKFYKIYVTASGIPIVVSGEFKLDMRVNGSVTGTIDATEILELGFDKIAYGLEYNNGVYTKIKDIQPVYKLKVAGKGAAKADLTISLLPHLTITAYEAVTAKVVLEPYLTANAGVEGTVTLDAEVDFNTLQPNLAVDADYRVTAGSLSAGTRAWLYADFHVWQATLLKWPSTADKATYTSYEPFELIASKSILGIPTLTAAVDTVAVHPSNSRAIKVQGTATNVPNQLRALFPALTQYYIQWASWTKPRIIAPLGVSVSAANYIDSPTGTAGEYWFVLPTPGIYTIRMGGYSSLGTYARQYTETQIVISDANGNGVPDWWEAKYGLTGASGSAIANADTDSDGSTNLQEWLAGRNPSVNDAPAVPAPTQTATIAQVFDDVGASQGLLSPNATTDDATPTLSGTLSAALSATQVLRVYDGANLLGNATVNGSSWTYNTPALLNGNHTLKVTPATASGVLGTPSNVFSLTIAATTTATGLLPDTGITAAQCYAAGSDALVSCTSAGAIALNSRQDGMVGRDVTTPSNADGKLGFSYVAVGSYPLTSCVKDNITGLTWEGKEASGTRGGGNAYTNYGDNRVADASAYAAAVNAAALCGYTDWRLPTRNELQSIVDYGVPYPGPTIDSAWFPNTQGNGYWTLSPYGVSSSNAWLVYFNGGHVDGYLRGSAGHVRLVR